MNVVEEKWNEIIEHLRVEHELSHISFSTWIQPLKVYNVVDNTVYLLVDKAASVDYIEKKYSLPLKVCIAEITGIEYEVVFLSEDDDRIEELKKMSSASTDKRKTKTAAEKAGLNPRYTFDTFIVGNNNNFAHAASLAVAESPGEVYNPLFLYGGVGLGKTHLMHSIAHFILDFSPKKKVVYVTSETFTNELIHALKNGRESSMSDFREKYRNTDVLQYIAQNVKNNIRELEGSLNKLIALYRLEGNGRPIDINLAAEAMKDILSPDDNKTVTPELIMDIVSDHFGVSIADLKSNKRPAEIAVPRQIVMYLCRKMTDVPLKSIGILLGGKNHSTIKHGVEKIEHDVEENEQLANTIDIIKKKINPV